MQYHSDKKYIFEIIQSQVYHRRRGQKDGEKEKGRELKWRIFWKQLCWSASAARGRCQCIKTSGRAAPRR